MVGAGLGGRVRRGGRVSGLLGELLTTGQREVTEDLVGGDVVEAGPVAADRLQQREGAHHVRGDERLRRAQRVVVVRLGREVNDGVGLPGQAVD